jgi:hypothetical protein
MTGLFRVGYFDPKNRAMNMEAFRVTARDAQEAIRKAERLKTFKYYRVESVDCLGFSDE